MSTKVAEIFETMAYGPAPEQSDYVQEWLDGHPDGFDLFIGGKWVAPEDKKKTIESRDPATGKPLARFSIAGKADVDKAVEAAQKGFAKWSKLSGHQRARHLYALARLIQKNSRFLSVLESMDNGKPIRETRDLDIPLAARHFYHHAGWAQLMDSELAGYEPLGVVGQVIPWNFPLLMMAWKIAPAIAAGNCVVLKPAEYTSLTALYFAEMCREAGLPDGVVNIITGAGDTGEMLVRHEAVTKIAFTGSTDVGRLIRKATAGTGKKLTLELGGKSPFLVFDDADLDSTVEGLVDAIWFNQGQVCCAGSRLLVEEGVADRLIEKVKHRLNHFRLGSPLDKAVDMGAIVDPVQRDRIDSLVNQSVTEGAVKWQPDVPCPTEGCYYLPTLLTDVSPANVAAREEIFGPVLTVTTFRTLAEATELANNSRYGLSASVWSENINRALEIAGMVKAGVVWINCTNQFDAACGFGGYRESGFGREGGREGMFEYLKRSDEWRKSGSDIVDNAKLPEISTKHVDVIDRTPKNYIGGKQKRPDGGNSLAVAGHDGKFVGRVGDGNRKDIRDAVEAAFKAEGWSKATAHNRAQILYYIAENLSIREEEFAQRLSLLTGASAKAAKAEVDASIARLFSYGAWADKFDGLVHTPPMRNIALAMNEPLGVMGVVCPDTAPLLSFISLIAPHLAMGNRSVVIPSQRYPLIATDFYQVLETSDVPSGAINIVTGDREGLAKVLAQHDQLDGIWYFGSAEGSEMVERLSADNLKRTWVNNGKARDWASNTQGEGRQFLREATQVKNVWLPYGD
ncbi:NADP-dependent aldehyde dehydrogenase [Iodidimonas muriae]|uniref:NADP-dependent aldehyde dehydrogenase n=1 Tax=Iodidimonas muriae TaxID=261467 RepID=A0ABQ2L738_9PROT|nr:aldehyde dehydrogenase family protein [Iodidimonas muriae]GGO05445.1 NADP-dependent aldehyde dehydrogenase [Iodidimonas muriae]